MESSAEDDEIFVQEVGNLSSAHRLVIDFDYRPSSELQSMADKMRRARERSKVPTREEFIKQTRRNGM